MASRWTAWRNKKKTQKYSEYDRLYRQYDDDCESESEAEGDPAPESDLVEPQPDNKSDSEIEDDPVEGIEENVGASNVPLKYRLANFVLKFHLSVEATKELLGILRDEGLDVPMSRITLLETPKFSVVPKKIPPGEYVHFGIQRALSMLAGTPHFRGYTSSQLHKTHHR